MNKTWLSTIDDKEELTEEEIQLAFVRVSSDYVCDCGDFYCSHNLLPFQKPDCC